MHYYDIGFETSMAEWERQQRRRIRLMLQEPGGRGYAVTTRRNGESSTVHLDDMPDCMKQADIEGRKRFL